MLSAYPERGWHSTNHMSNALRAWSLAGELVTIEYDEAFQASHNVVSRWDPINDKIWLMKVGPHMKI